MENPNRRPLAYDSLKAIFQYMEPNERIQTVFRCPHLLTVDRVVPLSIENLFLSPSHIIINQTVYQLGVYRHFEPSALADMMPFEKDNEKGGVPFDLNDFGEKDTALDQVLAPGESFIPPSQPHAEWDPEVEEQFIERQKIRLRYLKTLGPNATRSREIERCESRILIWKQKQEFDGRLPFTPVLQYTVKNSDGGKEIERYKYNKKMYEFMRYISNKIFGGRKEPIEVAEMKIFHTGGVLRLPPDVKFRVGGIKMGSNVGDVMKAIGPFIEGGVNYVSLIDNVHLSTNYQEPVIKTARGLFVHGEPVTGDNLEAVLNNTNQRLIISNAQFTAQHYLQLLNKMRDEAREMDTFYSFGIRNERIVTDLFRISRNISVGQQRCSNRGCDRFPLLTVIRKPDGNHLTIGCDRNEDYRRGSNDEQPWMLCIRVERIASVDKALDELESKENVTP